MRHLIHPLLPAPAVAEAAVYALLLLLAGSIPLPAAEPAPTAAREDPATLEQPPTRDMVTAIAVTGLRRTRIATVRRILDLRLPAPRSELDPAEIRERLDDSGLFTDDICIEFRALPNGSLVLELELQDRWTLAPIPLVGWDDGSWLGGFAVFELNLAGTGTRAYAGAVFEGTGSDLDSWSALLGGGGGVLRLGELEPSGSFAVVHANTSDVYPDESVYRRYAARTIQADLTLTYRPGTVWLLQTQTAFSGYAVSPDALPERTPSRNTPDSTRYLTQELQLEYDTRRSFSYYRSGARVQLDYRHGFPLHRGSPAAGGHFDAARLQASWTPELTERQRLSGAVTGFLSSAPPTELAGLSGVGYRTLPSSGTRAGQAAAAALEYELRFARLGWADATLSILGEAGIYTPNGKRHTFGGPGGGVHLYLSRLAIPAVGVTAAWNLRTGLPVISVSLGAGL